MAKTLKDFPVPIGASFEGERIRGNEMYVELGGPKAKNKFELVLVKKEEEVEDGKVTVIGKELKEIQEGSTIPYGVLVEVYGKKIERDMEGILERRIHDFTNYIHGMMHLNQRYDIWCRISKEAVNKGLTLKDVGEIMILLYKQSYKIIEKIQITLINDEEKVKEMKEIAMKRYKERDDRVKGMKDEEVPVFYGCTLCASFAPSHVCIVTPQRPSLCGALSWLDCRAAATIDPNGPNFPIEKGEVLDAEKGEFSGVNKVVEEYSHGVNHRFYLYSMFDYPHTSCGCFECIAFYMPEVDGIGFVDRNFPTVAVNGVKFSTMAGQSGGGVQTVGFLGFGIQWMSSEKFFKADGGWRRIVWCPSYMKERAKEYIPPDVFDAIATEKDVQNIDELKEFLKKKNHPVVKRWKEEEVEEKKGAAEEKEAKEEQQPVPAITPSAYPGMAFPSITIPSGGFTIILKNARIYAEKVIIKKSKSETQKPKQQR